MNPLSLFILAAALAASPKQQASFAVDSGTVSYKIVHKFHDVVGTTRKVTGTARLMSDRRLEFRATVPVATFDSGNDNRDVHMQEAVEAARFKAVELTATLDNFRLPKKFPAKTRMKVPAKVRFHGVEREEQLELAIQFLDARRVSVTCSFTVSLEAYRIERPSLMFVKIDDPMTVTANLLLKKQR